MICKILPDNIQVDINEKESLHTLLVKLGMSIPAACGGKGLCGKCKIRIVDGYLPVTPEDEAFFTEKELMEGFRLSCRAYPTDDIIIIVESDKSDLSQVSTSIHGLESMMEIADTNQIIAVDIGTTTIAMAYISGNEVQTYTTTNHQKDFGADVISRIVAANEGAASKLTYVVKEDIRNGVRQLIGSADTSNIRMVITGNTTMEHLLLGYDVSGLGVYPFTPVSVEQVDTDWNKLFGDDEFSMSITIMPGFTTYVGADILAGILACDMCEDKKNTLIVDLGTNGEMAIATVDKLYITSTAAGPAFEGGNISCGMPGVAGAVSVVKYENDSFVTETIDKASPVGICGSGIVDAIACMVDSEILDETGLLDEDYFDDGVLIAKGKSEVILTQKDIREMQLAKSAVRAGIETLIKKAGLTYEKIDQVYLAGGFGQFINIESAVTIGLLPEALRDKIKVVGNTALAGAIYYAVADASKSKAKELKELAFEVDLSTDKNFQSGYMDYIYFGE